MLLSSFLPPFRVVVQSSYWRGIMQSCQTPPADLVATDKRDFGRATGPAGKDPRRKLISGS